MNSIDKIALALDIYRLCEEEPKWFRAWVRHKGANYGTWRKETIPESQFGLVLALMRNPIKDQEFGCITEFLNEDRNRARGTPKVAYIPHDPEEATPFPEGSGPEHTVKVCANKPKEELTFNITGINPEQDMGYFIRSGVGGLLEWFENYKVEPEEVDINIREN